jgi:integrase
MSAAKRRTSVAKHTGVYYREDVRGRRRYEISYSDSDGNRRWKTVDGNLDDAQAVRDDLHQRMRKGERVAPTKTTVREFADEWLASQTRLRPRTRERYEHGLRHVTRRSLGRLRVSELREHHVEELIAEMEKAGLAGWTIRATLTPLGRMMARAVKRGMATTNPVAQLEKGDRPHVEQRAKRILERDEIDRLLAAAAPRKNAGQTDWRPLLATAIYTGLRFGEVLGLTWADVDFKAGLVRVRKQLGRDGKRVAPKTKKAVRDVVLAPALRPLLLDLKAGSRYSQPDHLVFCTQTGTPLQQRNVTRRGLEPAAERAGLIPTKEQRKAAKQAGGDGRPGLRFHDLRHCYASALIDAGADIVFVSEQLGHASPAITLTVYSHEWNKARKIEQMRAKLGSAFGTPLEHGGGDRGRTDGTSEPASVAENGSVSAIGDYRRPVAN